MTSSIPFRTGVLLLLATGAADPLAAQEAAQPAGSPSCMAAPGAPEATALVRYDCAGRDDGRVRYAVSLPAGWEVEQPDDGAITLTARQGFAGVFAQAADQLFVPVTAADSLEFWTVAAERMLGRTPSPREVRKMEYDALDGDGARFMITRAQSTDSALQALTALLASEPAGATVTTRIADVRTLGGSRAGWVIQRTEREGVSWRREGYITVHDGVIYGLIIQAPDTDWAAHEALWRQVIASYTIHPPRP